MSDFSVFMEKATNGGRRKPGIGDSASSLPSGSGVGFGAGPNQPLNAPRGGTSMPNSGFNLTDPTTKPAPAQTDSGLVDHSWNSAKGLWEFAKNNAGDIITVGGAIAGAFINHEDQLRAEAQRREENAISSADRAKSLAEQAREFDVTNARQDQQFKRTTGNEEAQAAVRAQTQLNKAPVADNAQALLLGRMGVRPTAFQGRDYTKGISQISGAPTGGSSASLNHGAEVARDYQPGDGGVNMDTTRALLAKMTGGAGLTPPVGPDESVDVSAVPSRMPDPRALLRRRMGA